MTRQERSVIIDSTCNYDETLTRGMALAQEHDYEYYYVECKVDNLELLDERPRTRVSFMSQRTGVHRPPADASDANDDEGAQALFKRWIEQPVRPESGAIIVDSTDRPEKCRDYIMECMSWSIQP